jgi:hypothetical protein
MNAQIPLLVDKSGGGQNSVPKSADLGQLPSTKVAGTTYLPDRPPLWP